MLLLNVVPEKWYVVNAVARIIGWGRDAVIDLINNGFLQAIVLPCKSDRRKRVYLCRHVQGCEIIRFVKDNLSIPEPRKMERRMR